MVTAVTTTAATASTMSTEQRAARRLCAAFCLATGFLLCGLAIPRGVAYGLIGADGGKAAAAVEDGTALSAAALADARRRFGEALAVHPADSDIALGLARLDLRVKGQGDEAALDAAMAHLRQAASHGPNETFIWAELARTAKLQGAGASTVIPYLRLSSLTGRFELSSVLMRSPVALSYWNELPEDMKEAARRDLGRLWSTPQLRGRLVRLYLDAGYKERGILLDEMFPEKEQRARFLKYVLARVDAS